MTVSPPGADERTTFLTSSWSHLGQMNIRFSNPGSDALMAVSHSGHWQTGHGGRSIFSDAGRKSESVDMRDQVRTGSALYRPIGRLETKVDSAGKWLNSRGSTPPPSQIVGRTLWVDCRALRNRWRKEEI